MSREEPAELMDMNFSTVKEFRLHWSNPYTLKWCGLCMEELPHGVHRAYSNNQSIYLCVPCANHNGLCADSEFLDSVVRPSYDELEERNPHFERIANALERIATKLEGKI